MDNVARRNGWRWLVAFGVVSIAWAQPVETSCGRPTVERVVPLTAYPRMANFAGIQGKVKVAATVSPDGSVKATRLVSGSRPLALDAQRLLATWRFSKCAPTCGPREATVTFSFVLEGHCTPAGERSVVFKVDRRNRVIVKSQRLRGIVD
jgi:TonB family protein